MSTHHTRCTTLAQASSETFRPHCSVYVLLTLSQLSLQKDDPINRLARHEQTTIFWLRTGHCGPRAYLKRIGVIDSALCDCKEAEQTAHHILQDCPIWRKQRDQLRPQDESTTNKLWGTAEDLRRTTQFLATCGLRV